LLLHTRLTSSTDSKASASASPAPKPEADAKTKAEPENHVDGSASKSPSADTLPTIVYDRKTPRTSKADGVSSLTADDAQSDTVRDKCVLMVYDALASDSNACEPTESDRGWADNGS
jgi:transcription elongation factor S-II